MEKSFSEPTEMSYEGSQLLSNQNIAGSGPQLAGASEYNTECSHQLAIEKQRAFTIRSYNRIETHHNKSAFDEHSSINRHAIHIDLRYTQRSSSLQQLIGAIYRDPSRRQISVAGAAYLAGRTTDKLGLRGARPQT
ncbi:hypothetical protein EVAR_38276_1 [Eumeta japonica]|uniref:Uncharacterized protein n=1 Tax=Eumeta variegata TaxID=151549 RepID=A0A4C1WAJ6_EUMVA|nr:hypothetical protein EVAR_38276_1 [Eumeta japonica]